MDALPHPVPPGADPAPAQSGASQRAGQSPRTRTERRRIEAAQGLLRAAESAESAEFAESPRSPEVAGGCPGAAPGVVAPGEPHSDETIPAALAEAQGALSLLAAADTVLDEVAFLLRRLRQVAAHATALTAQSQDVRVQQDHVFTLVREISTIGAAARFNGVPLFDGGLEDRTVWVGAAGLPVRIDLQPLDGRRLGIENPWGHANRATGMPARLLASTGTLPSGIFRVSNHDVHDEAGKQVGTYDESTVDFGQGVTATFDRSLYYRDEPHAPRIGTFTLNSVLSVRNHRAAQRALVEIADALEEVARRRTALAAARLRLSDAIATLGLLSASRRGRTQPEVTGTPEELVMLTVSRLRGDPTRARQAHPEVGRRALAGLLTAPAPGPTAGSDELRRSR